MSTSTRQAGQLAIHDEREDHLLAGEYTVGVPLDALAETGRKRIMLVSTASVYGAPLRQPISEDARAAPKSPYGASTLAVEQSLDRSGRGRHAGRAGMLPAGEACHQYSFYIELYCDA
ncbi:MAG: GDP-mannose 4,6-dehydratase [Sciscionella sp.]